MDKDNIISKIYHDPAGFSSIQKTFNEAKKKDKTIKLEDVLKWATLNGADFLGISNQFGTLEIGKKPGLVCFNENDFSVSKTYF